jgi:hypothetical protein
VEPKEPDESISLSRKRVQDSPKTVRQNDDLPLDSRSDI